MPSAVLTRTHSNRCRTCAAAVSKTCTYFSDLALGCLGEHRLVSHDHRHLPDDDGLDHSCSAGERLPAQAAPNATGTLIVCV